MPFAFAVNVVLNRSIVKLANAGHFSHGLTAVERRKYLQSDCVEMRCSSRRIKHVFFFFKLNFPWPKWVPSIEQAAVTRNTNTSARIIAYQGGPQVNGRIILADVKVVLHV